MGRRFLAALLAFASSAALARVPLGATVAPEVRRGLEGAYFIAFYTRTCLDQGEMARHWAALREAGANVLSVNAVEEGNLALEPPTGFERERFRALGGAAGLALARSMKVRTYPTTALVDAQNVVRDALEGALTTERVRMSLNLLPARP